MGKLQYGHPEYNADIRYAYLELLDGMRTQGLVDAEGRLL